uniref:Protein kinase domain-containing protein n=2 Tax=Aegilops tauschii subsp. strangulata TaxID=200361 RepID=A0A453SRR8_AEGTS
MPDPLATAYTTSSPSLAETRDTRAPSTRASPERQSDKKPRNGIAPERPAGRPMKPLYLRSSGSFKRLLLSLSPHRAKRVHAPPDVEHPSAQAEAASPPHERNPEWECFSYEEVRRATGGFRAANLVGRGGSSEVYRGELADGRAVAVKRLMGASACERRERDFLAELGTVGHATHPNVCPLLGCCVDRDLYLVFAFSARGSVSANLHDGEEGAPAMGWEARYGVAVGTARGLEYLHKGCRRRIIHRDIKASNVLLTDDFQPQVSHSVISIVDRSILCCAPAAMTHAEKRTTDLRLRAGQVAADRVDAPGDRADRGHLRVPGARVLHARHRGREDGRVRLRRLPAGAHGRPEAGGRHPQEPPRLGEAFAQRGQDGGAAGSEDRRRQWRLRRRAGPAAGVRGVAVRSRVGDVEAVHDRGSGAAGGRGDQGGAVGDAGAGGRGRRGGGNVGLRRPRRRRRRRGIRHAVPFVNILSLERLAQARLRLCETTVMLAENFAPSHLPRQAGPHIVNDTTKAFRCRGCEYKG